MMPRLEGIEIIFSKVVKNVQESDGVLIANSRLHRCVCAVAVFAIEL